MIEPDFMPFTINNILHAVNFHVSTPDLPVFSTTSLNFDCWRVVVLSITDPGASVVVSTLPLSSYHNNYNFNLP